MITKGVACWLAHPRYCGPMLSAGEQTQHLVTSTVSDADKSLPSAGTDDATVRAYTKLARDGHTGLLVNTKNEAATRPLMEVVRTVPQFDSAALPDAGDRKPCEALRPAATRSQAGAARLSPSPWSVRVHARRETRRPTLPW